MDLLEINTIAKDWFFSTTKDKEVGDCWPTITQMLTEFGEHLLSKENSELSKKVKWLETQNKLYQNRRKR